MSLMTIGCPPGRVVVRVTCEDLMLFIPAKMLHAPPLSIPFLLRTPESLSERLLCKAVDRNVNRDAVMGDEE